MLKWPAGDGSGTKQGSAGGTGVGESAARAFRMEGAAGMHRAEEAGATCASDRAPWPRA